MRFAPRAINRRRRRLPCRQYRSRIPQILLNHFLRRASQGNDAFLVALTPHQHVPEFELQILQLDVDDLRHPQRPGIKHFEDGAIANVQRLRYAIVFGACRTAQYTLDFVRSQ